MKVLDFAMGIKHCLVKVQHEDGKVVMYAVLSSSEFITAIWGADLVI